MLSSWMLYALVTLVLFGVAAITQKLATNYISAELSFIWFGVAFAVIALVLLVAAPMNWHLNGRTWFWTILAGACNALGAWASFVAYGSGGKASIVTPLAALYPIITAFLAVPILHEKVTTREIIGIGLAIIAAVMLSYEGTAKAAADPTKS